LKATRAFTGKIRYLSLFSRHTSRWSSAVAIALLTGTTYFLAARLGLILVTEPDGVAVFWPAAGISSGVLIALGQGARLPVAVSVMVATALANLIGDRNLAGSIVFAMCNAGEAIIIAWLIEHYCSRQPAPRAGVLVGNVCGNCDLWDWRDGRVHPVPQARSTSIRHLVALVYI
jgi:hypothetical protein